MERKFARFFHEQVKDLIENDSEREKVFESLRQYQSSQDLPILLKDLRNLLNEPLKLELYEHIRPLILPKHQVEYSQKTPQLPGVKLRVIRLKRQPGEGFGFAVRGGFEHGVNIFVSHVQQGSQADKRGLRVGDEIVRVNGFTIAKALHEDVLNLIKSRDEIILKVTHIGMLPVKKSPTDNVSWNYVDTLDSSKVLQEILDNDKNTSRNSSDAQDLKIFINTEGIPSIGCGIMSGPVHFPGIFVENVRPGSLAEEVGFEIGDQIMEVNKTSFVGITHKEAVVALRSSKKLDIVIRKKTGLPLFQQSRQRQRKPEPAATFKPTVLAEEPTPTPDVEPPLRTLHETNRVVSSSGLEDRDTDNSLYDQETIIKQHLDRRKFTTTVDVETTPPKSDDEPLPPPPPPEILEMLHRDSGLEVEAMTSFRSNQNEATQEVPIHDEPTADYTSGNYEEEPKYSSPGFPLGGGAAIRAARQSKNKGPALLGASNQTSFTNMDDIRDPYSLFPSEVTEGKEVVIIIIPVGESESLGIGVEGGIGTPLADKILISDVYGAAERHGEVEKGDQILMANGRSFVDLTANQALNILREAEMSNKGQVKLIVAKGGMLNDEDAVTYF